MDLITSSKCARLETRRDFNMNLSIGIVGLPNVGKSTLFNALTRKSVPADNYPFCTIDPSVGIVPVPDERLEVLSRFSKSKKTIPAVVEFVDIAGLIRGASKGEGLGNAFLSHVREVEAIAEVVRIFEDDNIIHVENSVDPRRDIDTIETELFLADMETVGKRLSGAERDARKQDKQAIKELALLKLLADKIEKEERFNDLTLSDDEKKIIQNLHLLSVKPVLYVFNKKTGGKNYDETNVEKWTELIKRIENKNGKWVIVDSVIEHELSRVVPAELAQFKKELGIDDDGIDNLIAESYKLLDLITFFTTGEDETRAWTIKRGSTAPEAGAAIHTDFRDKFIRAEIIFWKDLLNCGSHAGARERGLLRTEGRDYVVKDGDVIEFKI